MTNHLNVHGGGLVDMIAAKPLQERNVWYQKQDGDRQEGTM